MGRAATVPVGRPAAANRDDAGERCARERLTRLKTTGQRCPQAVGRGHARFRLLAGRWLGGLRADCKFSACRLRVICLLLVEGIGP